MASELVVEVTDQNFEELVIKSTVPVVVDFWAPWCGPCKMLAPIIDELAPQFEGTVTFGKVNVDDNPRIASRFGINSIPTMLFFKGGTIADQQIGLLAKGPLKNKIDALLR